MTELTKTFKSIKNHAHGMTKAKGCDHPGRGTFCKMFPGLSSRADDMKIKDACEAERITSIPGGPNGIMHHAGFIPGYGCIPVAYTFFGQFCAGSQSAFIR